MADLHHLGRAGGPTPRRRAARAVRPQSTPPASLRQHLLRRHEPPPRPGHDPGRRAPHHLPRRAHHRPRPAQPPHHVGHRARTWWPTASPSSSPRSTSTRPTSWPTGSPCSTAAGSSPRARPPSSSASSPAATSACTSPTAPTSARRRRSPAPTTGTDADALTLQVPSDGGIHTLRAVLDRLDDASVTVEDLSIHTPDLDDVFLALTGRAHAGDPTPDDRRPAPMTALTHTVADSATMLRRNLRHLLRYPSVTVMLVGMPVVFLLLFVYVFGGTSAQASARVAAARTGRVPRLRRARHPAHRASPPSPRAPPSRSPWT